VPVSESLIILVAESQINQNSHEKPEVQSAYFSVCSFPEIFLTAKLSGGLREPADGL
jgi:hypothetical protein